MGFGDALRGVVGIAVKTHPETKSFYAALTESTLLDYVRALRSFLRYLLYRGDVSSDLAALFRSGKIARSFKCLSDPVDIDIEL